MHKMHLSSRNWDSTQHTKRTSSHHCTKNKKVTVNFINPRRQCDDSIDVVAKGMQSALPRILFLIYKHLEKNKLITGKMGAGAEYFSAYR